MKVVVLTGGVGGAKLLLGLSKRMPASDITAIVNTGDDFVHLGLPISPDIDTLLYTLSGKANSVEGWGRENESWAFMEALRSLGGPAWFNLGDGDLALHIMRLTAPSLSQATHKFARAWNINVCILPMSEQKVSTNIEIDSGDRLAFQEYFVAQKCMPVVRSITFEGAKSARPAPGVYDALAAADIILIAPSNPWLSIDPILSVPGIYWALQTSAAPVVAVSPIIGGKAVKGPTAKLMSELRLPVTNDSIVGHYKGLIDGLVVDTDDECASDCIAVARTQTLMKTVEDRMRVADVSLALACDLIG